MAHVWIERRATPKGAPRYRVRYRLGGRESAAAYAGIFPTMREARARHDWVAGELAARRVPDVRRLETAARVTFADAAARWRRSRRDVAAGTDATYRVALNRLLPLVGARPLDELDPAAWNEVVEALSSLRRESIRKTLSVAAQVFDHEQIEPNPVRSPQVRLPRGEKRIVSPPAAEHILAVHRLLPSAYRLPFVVLEATGMRVGELEQLVWGDVDEPAGRWRVAAGKTDAATRWITPPPAVLAAVLALKPREDRTSEGRVFEGFSGDRFRTALGRACRAAAVPVFSPHDLRHRHVWMLHAAGVSWADIGAQVGHSDIVTTARTYTHVVADAAELDYERMLA